MKHPWLACLLLGSSLLFAGNQDSEFNVNSRYTVENVVVSGDGWTATFDPGHDRDGKLSSNLRREIATLVGSRLNPGVLDDLARRLRKEFHARTVEHRVLRGKNPEYVQVVFDIKLPPTRFDLSVPKFLYNSEQGWSGAVEGTTTVGRNGFTVGLVSDGDELAERFAGVVARYENTRVATDRVHFRFEFTSYHQQWNGGTREALDPASSAYRPLEASLTSPAYRTRQNFQPEVSVEIAKPLAVSFGASFERFQNQYPSPHTEAANAITAGVRYHHRTEGLEFQQDVDASYNLRAATRALSSDYPYTRHRAAVRYELSRGKSTLIDEVSAGSIGGRAPLFDRFYLGNSSTLRGWNKYELDPTGGNRMVHNSVDYRYGAFQIFYDCGAVWDPTETATVRHAAGVGLRQGSFSLALAFPIREGRIDPIFMVGMNY
jgi:hypothetical protein